MKKTVNYALNILFIAVISFLTVRLVFRDTDLKSIINDLHMASNGWLAVGVVCVFLFVCGESVIIRYMLRMFGDKTPFFRCLKYSFIGFFYSCITPSSSGGQPAQVIYMKKDGIKIGFSTLIMLVITVAYKSVLVIFGIVFFLLKREFVLIHVGKWIWLLLVGFFLNVAYISALVFILLKPLWARKAGIKAVNFLTRIHILKWKNNERYINKVNRICDNYTSGAEYIKTHVHAVINIFIITAVQRMFLLAVTYVVYKSYGLSGTSFLGIVTVQTMISITVEMLPLPGAAGITETCFVVMFADIFGRKLVRSGMLLSRGLSFYCLLFMGAAVTFAAHFISMRRAGAETDGGESDDDKEK
ncbi:MAG: YbhN family protein [Oscillospiraceae bacterium]